MANPNPNPTRLPPDNTYPAQPLTIDEAIEYTATRVPPQRTLEEYYNNDFSTPHSQSPIASPSPFKPNSIYRNDPPYPPPRISKPIPPHLIAPAEQLPTPQRLDPLTPYMLSKMTPQQARVYQWNKTYGDHYASLARDGWLSWERELVDVDAVERDFGSDSELRVGEIVAGRRELSGRTHAGRRGDVVGGDAREQRGQEKGRASGASAHKQGGEEDTDMTMGNDQAREENEDEQEEEVTEAEKVRVENNKRIALGVTMRTRGRPT